MSLAFCSGVAHAKDLGDILLKKGLITEDELKQAREEDKQKGAAEESRREAIVAKLPKWLEMITPFGDLRVRQEGFYEHHLVARNRFRFRARIGLTANVTDEASATFRLASGNSSDPISTNQDLTNVFSPKSINLDWAYLTLKPGKTFNIEPGLVTMIGGKFPVIAFKVSELVWDDDLAPEGFTETVNLLQEREGFLRGVRLNGFQWIVNEVSNGFDPWMGGAQGVVDTAFTDDVKLTLAFADYHYSNMNEVASRFLDPSKSTFNSKLANSNTLTFSAPNAMGTTTVTGYKTGFNEVNGSSELDFADPAGIGVPAGVFGDLVYNTQADGKNLGFYTGIGIGKAGRDWYHDSMKNPGDWGASYTYAWVEKDALVSLFTYSDWAYVQSKATQEGGTNAMGHIVRFDYALLQNLQLTAKMHFINALDRKSSVVQLTGNPTLVRTQFDILLKF